MASAAPLPHGMRSGDVVGVRRAAAAQQFRIDRRGSFAGMLQFFQHDKTGAFAQDETVAVLVKRPARLLWGFIAVRQCTGGAETSQAHRRHGRFRTTGQHHVRITPLDGPQRIADGVSGRGAGGGHGGVGAAQSEMNGDVARSGVGDHFRNDERADLARPSVQVTTMLLLELIEAADAAAENDAAAERVFPREVDAAVFHGVDGGHESELSETIEPAQVLASR